MGGEEFDGRLGTCGGWIGCGGRIEIGGWDGGWDCMGRKVIECSLVCCSRNSD